MRIIAVDDEQMGLRVLTDAITKCAPEAEVTGFRKPAEALEFARHNDIYIAFMDIRMAGMSGIELGKQLKIIKPTLHIVFATGYDSYMGDAFSLHAHGYILKPVTPQKVQEELDSIKDLSAAYKKRGGPQSGRLIRFQCFGNFEAFVNDKPVRFKYDKTKELLAFLVSRRGALCSNGEIILNIWDDDINHESYLRGIRKDLIDTLKELGAADVISSQRGKMGVNVKLCDCDYYDFIAGDVVAINSYAGEFMSQYSWGEMTNAELDTQRFDYN